MKIAYILQTFPTLSETFVLNELIQLKAHNHKTNIYSIGLPQDKQQHPEVKPFLNHTYYHKKTTKTKKLIASLKYALLNPIGFIKTIYQLTITKPTHLRFIPSAAYFAHISEKNKIQHFHAHFAGIPATYALIVSNLRNKPYSLTAHANEIFINPNKRLLKLQINNSKFSATPSIYNKQYLTKLTHCNPDKIKIVHATIDNKKFQTKNKQTKNIITFAARLCEKKGTKYLIEAMKNIKDHKLLIFGKGPELNYLKTIAPDNAEFKGTYTTKELHQALEQSKLFVLPCIIDSYGDRDVCPLTIQEAMAMQVPIISTTIASIPELVTHNKEGLLVEPKNPQQLETAIKKIINNKKLQKQMAKAARKKIDEEFNIYTQYKILEGLFLK